MIKLLEFLWHGCWHDWKFETTRKVEYVDVPVSYAEAVYTCNKCHRFKALKV